MLHDDHNDDHDSTRSISPTSSLSSLSSPSSSSLSSLSSPSPSPSPSPSSLLSTLPSTSPHSQTPQAGVPHHRRSPSTSSLFSSCSFSFSPTRSSSSKLSEPKPTLSPSPNRPSPRSPPSTPSQRAKSAANMIGTTRPDEMNGALPRKSARPAKSKSTRGSETKRARPSETEPPRVNEVKRSRPNAARATLVEITGSSLIGRKLSNRPEKLPVKATKRKRSNEPKSSPKKKREPIRGASPVDVDTSLLTRDERLAWLRTRWDVAFVVAFCSAFRSHLGEGAAGLDAMKFESALLGPEADDELHEKVEGEELLAKIHCAFLSNVLNRKKRLDYRDGSWKRLLSETIDKKMKTGSMDFVVNPVMKIDMEYADLSLNIRIRILRILCEWQLTDNTAIHSKLDRKLGVVEHKGKGQNAEVPLTTSSFAMDSDNREYFRFGDETARIYRRSIVKKKKADSSSSEWEAVTSNIDDLQCLAVTLKESDASTIGGKTIDKAISDTILEMIPKLEAVEKRKERQAKTVARLATQSRDVKIYETRTRTRSKPVHYDFGDFYGDMDPII